jgi:sRNA-binding protein
MKHTAMTTTRQFSREDKENVVRMLVKNYPKCFFENPRQRRPLKNNIAADIIADKILEVSDDLIASAVDWYRSNIGISYAMSAPGATRIDLNGDVAGKVTPAETLEAQKIVNEFHAKKNAEANNPIRTLNNMYANGRIPDDIVKKQDAPMDRKGIGMDATVVPTRTKAAAIAPEFASIYETLAIANNAVNGISDPTIRLAVAKATLEEVVKAAMVRDELAAT